MELSYRAHASLRPGLPAYERCAVSALCISGQHISAVWLQIMQGTACNALRAFFRWS
jgi:hypothetical protein